MAKHIFRNSRRLRWFFLSCIIILSAAAVATLVAVLLFAFDVTDSGTAVVILCVAVAIAAVAAALFRQGRALGNAEAVLLIGDDKTEVGVFHAAGNEGVGADGKVDFSVFELLGNRTFGFGRRGAGEQGAADAKGLHKRRKRGVMLLRQNFCGSHESGLEPIFYGEVRTGCGDHGLAGTHITLA